MIVEVLCDKCWRWYPMDNREVLPKKTHTKCERCNKNGERQRRSSRRKSNARS